MKRLMRTNQGGSVITFAIVGTILVLLLAGGVYYAYQRGEHARSGEPLIGSSDKKTTPAPSKSSNNSDTSKQTAANTDENSATTQTQPTTSQQSPTNARSTTPNEIPQTGPANTPSILATVLVLTLAIAYYVRSRATLRSL